MAPADSKDWLFAATALTTAVTSTAAAAADTSQAGVITGAVSSTRSVSGVTTNASAAVLGDIVRPGEEFRTGPGGLIHILFLDQSSVTLGPDSRLTLDNFSHDDASRSGKITMTLHEGNVRVVGGLNSKNTPTEVRTSNSTVAILGGISVVQSLGGNTSATFLFGTQMTVSNNSGQSQTILRPGFSSTTSQNSSPSAPAPLPTQQMSSLISNFENGNSRNSGNAPGATPTAAPAPQFQASSTGSSGGTGGGGSVPQSLISTSDKPSGQSAPPTVVALDRLSNPSSAMVGPAMSNNRSDSTLDTQGSTPVNAVRTVPPPAAVS